MELLNFSLQFYILLLIYFKVTSQSCNIHYHYQVTLYETECTYREYICESITSSSMLTQYYNDHEEETCGANNYCYTMTIANSQIQHLNDDTFVTSTTCSPAKVLRLTLSGNNIENLSENIFIGSSSSWSIYELRELLLSHNRITNVQSHFFMYLLKLQVLDLSFNQLRSIGNFSYNLPLLEELYLNDNQISKLSGNVFDKLTRVTILNLSENKISVLDGAIFRNMPQLQTLGLSNNRIVSFSQDLFHGLSKLSDLSLMQNVIEELPIGVFKDLQALENLQLGGNRIAELKMGSFSGLANLAKLNLSNNGISEVDDIVFFALHSLTVLDLSSNNLSSVKYSDLLSHLPELKTIYIDGNGRSCLVLIDMIRKFGKRGVKCIITSENKFNVSNINGVSCQQYINETESEEPEMLENISDILMSINSKMNSQNSQPENEKPEYQVNVYGIFIIIILLCLLIFGSLNLVLTWIKYSRTKNNIKDVQLCLLEADL